MKSQQRFVFFSLFLQGNMEGIGWPKFDLRWTLVGFHCYLIFSLNFVGLFAQQTPQKIDYRGQHFRASPQDNKSFYNPQQYSTEDSIDLSKIPPVVPQKLIENSIDRFDAYGDYEYIDVEQHPQQQIQHHRPLQHRPQTLHQHHNQHQPNNNIRRVDHHHPNHRYPTHPHHDPSPIYSIGYPQRPLGPPHGYGGPPSRPFNPIQALRPPKFDLFGFLNLEKNDQIYPGTQPLYAEEEESGFFDPLLSLIGLKEDPIQQDYDYPTSQYHDPLEYDYGDYVEGYQNYVKPQRPKTLGQRVAKWFGGFKIPSKKSKLPKRKNFQRVESAASNNLDYTQYDTDNDQNLIFYNDNPQQQVNPNQPLGTYDFEDVVHSIRNNETSGEVFKKFLSAAAALSERSDSNPVFMMWTIPTTILALLGIVYFVGAMAIVGYKYMLDGTANPANLISVVIVFTIPLILGFFIVGSRSTINGELQMNRIMRGDLRGSMRQDFDGVDFVMDAIFGASGLLGIGWLASISI